jgi:hypothetical protein
LLGLCKYSQIKFARVCKVATLEMDCEGGQAPLQICKGIS